MIRLSQVQILSPLLRPHLLVVRMRRFQRRDSGSSPDGAILSARFAMSIVTVEKVLVSSVTAEKVRGVKRGGLPPENFQRKRRKINDNSTITTKKVPVSIVTVKKPAIHRNCEKSPQQGLELSSVTAKRLAEVAQPGRAPD
jgi:hypothetical protein